MIPFEFFLERYVSNRNNSKDREIKKIKKKNNKKSICQKYKNMEVRKEDIIEECSKKRAHNLC